MVLGCVCDFRQLLLVRVENHLRLTLFGVHHDHALIVYVNVFKRLVLGFIRYLCFSLPRLNKKVVLRHLFEL